MVTAAGPERLHPIRVVVKRTGLSSDVLRVWERRYGAVSPVRSDGERRLYSDSDIERLLLLRRATDGGRAIGQVATLPTADLRDLVRQDEAAGAAAPAGRRTGRTGLAGPRAAGPAARDRAASDALEEALHRVAALDVPGLDEVLQGARLTLSPTALLEQVVVPLLHRIGEDWREGRLRIAHEHAASAAVRSLVAAILDSARVPEDAPLLVAATPAGQQHELGALMAAATAAFEGWRVLYLGPNLPAEDIAAAASQAQARAVALSVVHPHDDRRLPDELRRLRRGLSRGVPILVGGSAASSYAAAVAETGGSVLDSLAELRRALERARSG